MTTSAGTFVISPANTVGVTIADNYPSASGYLVEISYDNGATWQPVGAAEALGLNTYNPATQFPSVEASTAVVFRATNNDTSVSGVSTPITLTADAVLNSFTGNNDTDLGVDFVYQSDNTAAGLTGGDPMTMTNTADCVGGPQTPDTATNTYSNHINYVYTGPLFPTGSWSITSAGDVTWDRPAAVYTPPQGGTLN